MSGSDKAERSEFRRWFEDYLRHFTGKNIEWPQLMRVILDENFSRLKESGQYYSGEVFKDRDKKIREYQNDDRAKEEIQVYNLYRTAHNEDEGCLTLGNERIWLVSCEVPNQGKTLSGKTRKRRADLLGLRPDGSLVVFECKVGTNKGDTPLYALLEGLDYLGCLLTRANFLKLSTGFEKWRKQKLNSQVEDPFVSRVPDAFLTVRICRETKHSVLVLAPKEYYDRHLKDKKHRHQDWWYLSDRLWESSTNLLSVKMEFVVSDYGSTEIELVEPPSEA